MIQEKFCIFELIFIYDKLNNMKQTIILWLSALFITLLAGYTNNVTSPEFPVSGTIGINGKKVTYYFDKVLRDSSNYKVLIRTDIDSVKGRFIFSESNNNNLDTITLANENQSLIGELPFPGPLKKIHYKVELERDNKKYFIPTEKGEEIVFMGKVPTTLKVLLFITFFIGLLFSVRTGLEYFNPHPHTKKMMLFTIIPFALYGFFVSPVYKTFELNMVGSQFANPLDLFRLSSLSYFCVWTFFGLIIFKAKDAKFWGLVASIITLVMAIILH
jgi:hypothetical protein